MTDMNPLQNKIFLALIILLAIYHVISSLVMTREIMVWVPNKKRKLKLLLLVWLVPFFGLRLANKKAQLGLFEPSKEQASSSTVGASLLEIEAVFNPGVKHRVEAVQEHKVKVIKKNEQDHP